MQDLLPGFCGYFPAGAAKITGRRREPRSVPQKNHFMKKAYNLYLVHIFMFLSFFSFLACEKAEAPPHRRLDPAEFDQIGIEHNKALATVYDALYQYRHLGANFRPTEYSQEGALQVSENTLLSYLEENQEFTDESE